MNFWKTSFWALISTVARLSSQFVVAKFIAVFCGVAAFGIIGQFQSFISLIQLGAGSVVSGGVTKYAAEHKDAPDVLKKVIGTATKFAFISSFITGFFIICFSSFISQLIFQTKEYHWIIAFFGATLFAYALNQVLMSVLNGLHQMRYYATISVVGAIFSIIITGTLAYFFKTKGALLGSIVSQFILFLVGYFIRNKTAVEMKIFSSKVDKDILRKLLKFSCMAITSAIVLPLTQMIIRNYVVNHSSWSDVGYWQAVVRISDAYLLIITTIIGTYALPKYSQILDKIKLKKEVFSVMAKLLPFVILSAAFIYVFRFQIIGLLFSTEFYPMANLFLFQLLGDVIKIASWVIGNIMLAKAKIRIFIIFEILFSSSFCVLSIFIFKSYGTQGLTLAFFANYFLYFIVVLIWFLRFVKNN